MAHAYAPTHADVTRRAPPCATGLYELVTDTDDW